jgi:hypothetical protein
VLIDDYSTLPKGGGRKKTFGANPSPEGRGIRPKFLATMSILNLLREVNLGLVVINREFVLAQEIESGDAGYFRSQHF